MSDPYRVILRPVVTEKSYHLSQARKPKRPEESLNAYTFDVDPGASKCRIREAIEQIFNVRVLKVRTMAVRGKARQLRRGREGRRRNWKKAIVTLTPEYSIPIY